MILKYDSFYRFHLCWKRWLCRIPEYRAIEGITNTFCFYFSFWTNVIPGWHRVMMGNDLAKPNFSYHPWWENVINIAWIGTIVVLEIETFFPRHLILMKDYFLIDWTWRCRYSKWLKKGMLRGTKVNKTSQNARNCTYYALRINWHIKTTVGENVTKLWCIKLD